MAAATGMAVTGVPWHGIDVGSPFDHARQGIRYVATHLPLPGREGPSDQLLDELVELAEASGAGSSRSSPRAGVLRRGRRRCASVPS